MENKENVEDSSSRKQNSSSTKGSLKEILSYIESTDLECVVIEKNGKKFSFRRSGIIVDLIKNPGVSGQSPKENGAEPVPEADVPQFCSIRSPIVGRFYRSMGPDRPPLVVEGGQVTAGQRVAVVEAMKIKKEVFSAYTGKILRILIRDGDPVEYGQELFSVETEQETP